MNNFVYNHDLKVSDRSSHCFICNKVLNVTNHHLIPKRLHPSFNKIVQLCKHCHSLIHLEEDKELNQISKLKDNIKILNKALEKQARKMKRLKKS